MPPSTPAGTGPCSISPDPHSASDRSTRAQWPKGSPLSTCWCKASPTVPAPGGSASKDHYADAVAVWVALHGLATLLADSSPSFPWPDHDQLVNAIVGRLALLDAGPEAER